MPDVYPFDDTIQSNIDIGGLEDIYPAGVWSSIPVPFALEGDDHVVDEGDCRGVQTLTTTPLVATADVKDPTAPVRLNQPAKDGE